MSESKPNRLTTLRFRNLAVKARFETTRNALLIFKVPGLRGL